MYSLVGKLSGMMFSAYEFQHQTQGPLEASDRMQKNLGKKRILSERSEFIRDPNFSNE